MRDKGLTFGTEKEDKEDEEDNNNDSSDYKVKCRVRVQDRSSLWKDWCYRDDQHSSEILSARGVQIHLIPKICLLVTFAWSCTDMHYQVVCD